MAERKRMKVVLQAPLLSLLFLSTQTALVPSNNAVCPFTMDLAFLLDASGSIGRENYQRVKTFVSDIIDYFAVSQKGTHIGLVLFSTNATTMIRFDGKGQHSEEIKTQIANMRYPGGSTRLSLALSTARQQLFSVQGGTRIDVTRVVLAVTDGASDKGIKKTRESSKLLKDDGIVIYALGIGNEVRPGELDVLVSSPSPDHVFRFSSVKQMASPRKAQEVARLLCSAARKTGAVLFPVLQQHSLQGHVMTSAVVTDDNACALNCLSHHACYSFNFMTSRKLCELSDSTRNQFPLHLVRNRSVVYYEMDFT